MKEAFGGIFNIMFVVIFLVVIIGVLGLVFSYTKAFKMKNIVISAIEEYEDAQCINTSKPDTACRNKIRSGAQSIGYSPSNIHCPSGTEWESIDDLFCVQERRSQNGHKIYRIVTQVDINIPIIRHIMGLSFFQVSGDTRVVQKQ